MRVTEVFNRKTLGGTLAGCLVLGLGAGVELTSAATAQPAAHAASGKSLELIEVTTGIPYYNPLVSAFKAEAAKLGDTATVVGPATVTASSQIPEIQQATVQHINGIAIQPNDAKAPLPALQQAIQQCAANLAGTTPYTVPSTQTLPTQESGTPTRPSGVC